MSLSSPMTVIGMVNGMIGGFILILPVNALAAGWLSTLLVIIIIGLFSFYSCYLCVIHLGDQKDLDHAMYIHFNKNLFIKILYDLTVFSNLLFIAFLYFQLICIQWEGITGSQSIIIPLLNMGLLFILVFVLKYFQFGASIMAYGIISIAGYVIFLMWVIASSPSGDRKWQAFGTGEVDLAAAMGGAYSIQTFFIPVLKKNPYQQKYVFFTFLANLIGMLAYTYIAFMGAFGILHRASSSSPQDIQQFFPSNTIQVKIIQIIYLIHLYSVFPQFTLISKKRLFSIFRIKETVKGQISLWEVGYAAVFVGICLLIRLLKVKIDTIVDINGSVIGFFFIYFLPTILHIRCQYFAKNKITFQRKAQLINHQKVIDTQRHQQHQQKTQRHQQIILGQKKVQKRKSSAQMQLSYVDYRKSNQIYKQLGQVFHLSPQVQLISSSPQNFLSQHPVASVHQKRSLSIVQTILPYNFNHPHQQNLKQSSVYKTTLQQPQELVGYYVCQCRKPTKWYWQVGELTVLVIMVAIGTFIMVNGIISVSKTN